MALAHKAVNPISEQEYLAGEKQAEVRHEYSNGHVYAMAGASKQHNRIARNFINRLEPFASAKPCEIYFSDMKVKAEKYKAYYYPDVVISCDPSDASSDYFLEKPCLIIEVSSDSTVRRDYLDKALAYQSIASVQAYLIVAQDKVQIDLLTRTSDNGWDLQKFDQLTETLYLPCLAAELDLASIYKGVFDLGL